VLENRNEWKQTSESKLYDYQLIEKRFQLMRTLRKQNNIRALAQCLRQSLVKNIGNTSHMNLYNKCYSGTKKLIEAYHNEVIKSIRAIYFCKSSKLSLTQKVKFFSETRQSYGYTALMLSGGATLGKYHFGLLKVLYENDLLPRTLCGSSIGSLVSAAICSRSYEQVEVSEPIAV
jgi:hypothetical protein